MQAAQQQQYGLMQDCQAHMGTVEAQAGAALTACFSLLGRVSEVDSMVRVLHLVTVMLEALGPKAQPHFHTITAALPKVMHNLTLQQRLLWVLHLVTCCKHCSPKPTALFDTLTSAWSR